MNIAIVVGEFHKDIAEVMVSSAKEQAKESNLSVTNTYWVSGSYEAPLVTRYLLADDDVAGVVVLGYIEKGETLHGEVMGHVVHKTLVDLQLEFDKPVGLGIIGPGATVEQAKVRMEGSAKAAVKAVATSLGILEQLA